MRLQHTKACYINNFRIAPHFVSVLNHESSKSVIYFLSFNESLNKTTLECEMDLLIGFQDETDNDVKVSLFRHTTTKDLSNQFKETTKSLVLAMNELNIDLKFYEALKQERAH